MAHTVDAIVYDPTTNYLQMIVIPDDDSQLNDPAFNPPNMVQLRVPLLSATAVLGPTDATSAAIKAAQTLANVTITLAAPAPVVVGNVAGAV